MSTVGSLRARANEDRPRERLGRLGGEHLSSAELLAVVLGTGQREQGDALSLAHRLLVQFGDLAGLQQARLGELQQVGGIGEVKAARVLAALEAGRRSLRPGLQPGVVLELSKEIIAEPTPYLRTRRSALATLALLRKAAANGELKLSRSEQRWLDKLSTQADSLPEDEKALIDMVLPQINRSKVRLEEYGLTA